MVWFLLSVVLNILHAKKQCNATKKLDKSSKTEIFNSYFLSVSMLMLIEENGDVSDTLATN